MSSVTDVVEWLAYRDFPFRVFAETYMRDSQKGRLYHQQEEALDFFYGAHEPEKTFETGGELERLRTAEVEPVQAELYERPITSTGEPSPTSQPQVTPIPSTEPERQTLANRLFRTIRRLFGG